MGPSTTRALSTTLVIWVTALEVSKAVSSTVTFTGTPRIPPFALMISAAYSAAQPAGFPT